jgi:hypothetical protein
MTRKRTRQVGLIAASLLVAATAYWAWDHRFYWIEHRFREINPGRVYAGGYNYPGPLARILRTHKIKTVLSLLSEGTPEDIAEQQVVVESGVAFKRVVILPKKADGQKLDGTDDSISARLDRVEEAVTLLADPQNQPVFVHCRLGKHRAGAVVAVYRVRHCGWSEERARNELTEWGGFDGTRWPGLVLQACCSEQGRRIEEE